jgi:hypothetical protein
MLKRVLLTAVCTLALAAPAIAQQNATIVLRSGERIGGSLVDLNRSGYVMNVNGQTRNIPAREVAAVEFASRPLTPDQQAKLNTGQSFIVLNNGQTIDGRLNDIGGTYPLRLTVDTSNGRQDFNSTDVAAVYNGRGRAGFSTLPAGVGTSGQVGSFVVPANQQWTPTNLTVSAGETLGFQTDGEIHYSPDVNDRAISAGSLGGRRVPRAPIQSALAGALIGRIGNGPPFAIGNLSSVRMPASGLLFLGINDDNVGDNSGNFQVTISR